MPRLTTIKKVYKTKNISKANIAQYVVEARLLGKSFGDEAGDVDLYENDVDLDRLHRIATIPGPKPSVAKDMDNDQMLEWARKNLPSDLHVTINI